MLKAAIEFNKSKLGNSVVIGNEKRVKETLEKIGLDPNFKIQIVNSTDSGKREKYAKYLYKKLQRTGQLERDVDRLIRNDRVAFGASMVACKDADAMVTGNIRHYAASVEKLKNVCDARSGEPIFGMTMMVFKGRTLLVADTNVQDFPTAARLVQVSKSCVRVARLFGFDPKVAFLSHSTFGKPISRNTKHVREAIDLLKKEKVDFDFDGEMQPDVAGPLLVGLDLPIEVAPLRSSTSDILNLASIAAFSSDVIDYD